MGRPTIPLSRALELCRRVSDREPSRVKHYAEVLRRHGEAAAVALLLKAEGGGRDK